MTTAADKPVWFITGCSTGFGRALARHTLSLGYPTVVTARNAAQVEGIIGAMDIRLTPAEMTEVSGR